MRVHVDIEYPEANGQVSDSVCGVFVAGRAIALLGELQRFDVAIVIDTSQSTNRPSGADINGNGRVGRPHLGRLGTIFGSGSTDPGDSILAAEVAAARQLMRSLDPRSTRVTLVTFSGENPDARGGLFSSRTSDPALTEVPLTADFARVDRALDRILERGPRGLTHMAAGVDQATIELLGLSGASSEVDPKSEKVVLFFTDGQPTLPFVGFNADNVRAVLRAADRSDRGQIRIHSYAIGPDALDGPIATMEMARRTDGFFTPVRHPGDLVDVIEGVSFANLEELVVRSATTGEAADPLRTAADGSWVGFVKMREGSNTIEVLARATDGTEAKTTLDVTFVPDAENGPVPANLLVQRNRLLEDCLVRIKQVRLDAEQEHAEKVRRNLRMEIERERVKARERADEQRKRLDLEVDGEGDEL